MIAASSMYSQKASKGPTDVTWPRGALALLLARAGEEEDGQAGRIGALRPRQPGRAERRALQVEQGEAGLVVDGDAAQPAVRPSTPVTSPPGSPEHQVVGGQDAVGGHRDARAHPLLAEHGRGGMACRDLAAQEDHRGDGGARDGDRRVHGRRGDYRAKRRASATRLRHPPPRRRRPRGQATAGGRPQKRMPAALAAAPPSTAHVVADVDAPRARARSRASRAACRIRGSGLA